MENVANFSSLNEENFLRLLRDILDEYFSRQRTSKLSNEINGEIRQKGKELLRSTNPSSFKSSKLLPENLREIYSKFVHDYRRDIERYHIEHASEFLDEHRLKNFDWNIRIALHDEHLFKCRLPLMNLQLELTDGQKSENVHLELDEQELTRLIDQMTEIEQAMNNYSNSLTQ